MIEEETQEEGKKEKKSREEEVTPADEGEMLLENRASFGFQRIENEDPKEDPIHIEPSIISTPTIPSGFPHKSTQKTIQSNPFFPHSISLLSNISHRLESGYIWNHLIGKLSPLKTSSSNG